MQSIWIQAASVVVASFGYFLSVFFTVFTVLFPPEKINFQQLDLAKRRKLRGRNPTPRYATPTKPQPLVTLTPPEALQQQRQEHRFPVPTLPAFFQPALETSDPQSIARSSSLLSLRPTTVCRTPTVPDFINSTKKVRARTQPYEAPYFLPPPVAPEKNQTRPKPLRSKTLPAPIGSVKSQGKTAMQSILGQGPAPILN